MMRGRAINVRRGLPTIFTQHHRQRQGIRITGEEWNLSPVLEAKHGTLHQGGECVASASETACPQVVYLGYKIKPRMPVGS